MGTLKLDGVTPVTAEQSLKLAAITLAEPKGAVVEFGLCETLPYGTTGDLMVVAERPEGGVGSWVLAQDGGLTQDALGGA